MSWPDHNDPEACDLYLPGHHTHWIQARMASAERQRWGRLVAVDDDVVTVAYLDGVRRYRNHQAETLLNIVAPGTKVAVCERYQTLRIDIDHLEQQVVLHSQCRRSLDSVFIRAIDRSFP